MTWEMLASFLFFGGLVIVVVFLKGTSRMSRYQSAFYQDAYGTVCLNKPTGESARAWAERLLVEAETEEHLLDTQHQRHLAWRHRRAYYLWRKDRTDPAIIAPCSDEWHRPAPARYPDILPLDRWSKEYFVLKSHPRLYALLERDYQLVVQVWTAKLSIAALAHKTVARPRTVTVPPAHQSEEAYLRDLWKKEGEKHATYDRLDAEVRSDATISEAVRARRLQKLSRDREAAIDALYGSGDDDDFGDTL